MKYDLNEECNKIINFWKLEEFFAPLDYPELMLTIKEGNRKVKFDAYHNDYSTRELPLNVYKEHNNYLIQNNKSNFYNRANIYCGCYKTKKFVEKMAEKCNLDMEKYAEINELSGRFYIFSVQIDLNGKLTEEGVQISPFFYAVLSLIKAENATVNIMQEDIWNLNEDINEILKQNATIISNFADMENIKYILFDKLGIQSEKQVGLEGASDRIYACKGLRQEDETGDFSGFYLNELETVQKDYINNRNVINYTTSLLMNQQKKIMIDSDVDAMKKWLDVEKFPLAKYPSKFSPTLMQQVAINIAISENDRNEKIFSVNGPPGTGKTTLLKEIIASNVEQLAEVLIKYGIDGNNFVSRKIESASSPSYTEKYYEIPEEISKFGILVVSNNNGAVENITLDLPKADGLTKENTRTDCFDRNLHEEVYFSAVADALLGQKESSWGLISARMGRKSYVNNVLRFCIFARKNDASDKVTLDLTQEKSISWAEAVDKFRLAKDKVLSLRQSIKKDQKILDKFYEEKEKLSKYQWNLNKLVMDKENLIKELNEVEKELINNESETENQEEEIKYIKKHTLFLKKILIVLGLGEIGKYVGERQKNVDELVLKHEEIKKRYKLIYRNIEVKCSEIEDQNKNIFELKEAIGLLEGTIYGENESLKSKYKDNLADRDFYANIKESENSQNACPWTFDEYDKAREELFYASLQVRKAFILKSPYIRRNLFVYDSYNRGQYTISEKIEMFPHLLNALSVVIPVISSTFASVGRFLKHAGNESLGMLVVDESGQATPQSALGAIYRTRRAIVVGDPLQVEPVVTIPKVLINILADSIGVPNEYKLIENSVQTFADSMNEFNSKIGERQVGCPLVVHRRCIDPMFSISNMISYDNRMFNKTNRKEEYLKQDKPFLIKKSGWINVEGPENGNKNHFVKKQAEKVCQLLKNALIYTYNDLFETDDKIFIITPFRTVAESMRKFVISYFEAENYEKELLSNWSKKCIGTVHTFQGKDANEVLFVLGCSNQSEGAMNWVVKNANILNVACTRAKYRVAFIGNMSDWKNRRFFEDFIPDLIDKIDDENIDNVEVI